MKQSLKLLLDKITAIDTLFETAFPKYEWNIEPMTVKVDVVEPTRYFASRIGIKVQDEALVFELGCAEDFDLVTAQLKALILAIDEYAKKTPIPQNKP